MMAMVSQSFSATSSTWVEVAEKLCHQIAIIKDGRLIKNGLTVELVGDSSLEDVFLELEGEKE